MPCLEQYLPCMQTHGMGQDEIVPSHSIERDEIVPSHSIEQDEIVPSHTGPWSLSLYIYMYI